MARRRPVKVESGALPLLWVRSPDGRVFWERHPAHPGGEAWVAGHGDEPSAAVQVAETEAVVKALREGRLEKVQVNS